MFCYSWNVRLALLIQLLIAFLKVSRMHLSLNLIPIVS